MKVLVNRTDIPDLLVIDHEVFEDDRGFFMEVFRADVFESAGLPSQFVQANHSRSTRGVVRGLHFQWDPPMGKLMRVTRGTAFLVAVDIRLGSPTFGQWHGMSLSDGDRRQVWAPAGIARGFCVVSEVAEIQYLTTGTHDPDGESGIRWDDPRIGIKWPLQHPLLSDKDRGAQSLDEWSARPEAKLLAYRQ